MSKADFYNFSTQIKSELELPARFFSVKVSRDLLYQSVVAELANKRNTVAHTKTRGEVRGGGKKPWKQKGTGRARAGSIRSPIWKGGGVTFGPRSDRNYAKKLNRVMWRKALFGTLSEFALSGSLAVFDGMNLEKISTKEFSKKIAELREKLGIKSKKIVLVLAKPDKNLEKSAGNIPNLEVLKISELSPFRLLRAHFIAFSKEAFDKLPEHFK